MNIERLITMANDIATYFTSEPDADAALLGVSDHLTKFWDPSMRRQLKAYVDGGGAGLMPLAQAAVGQLAASAAPPRRPVL